jgi:hypothetical protein
MILMLQCFVKKEGKTIQSRNKKDSLHIYSLHGSFCLKKYCTTPSTVYLHYIQNLQSSQPLFIPSSPSSPGGATRNTGGGGGGFSIFVLSCQCRESGHVTQCADGVILMDPRFFFHLDYTSQSYRYTSFCCSRRFTAFCNSCSTSSLAEAGVLLLIAEFIKLLLLLPTPLPPYR